MKKEAAEKAYFALFNTITDIIDELETAVSKGERYMQLLKNVQILCEEFYISTHEDET